MQDRKYKFSWDLLGDIGLGRPNLGPTTRIEVYRLMQGTFRDILEQNFGTEKADEIFYDSGKLAGQCFYQNVLGDINDFEHLIKVLQDSLLSMGIGVLRVEESDLEKGSFVFTVSEDLDCSGLPELDYEICTYDEGFIAGLLECFTGKGFEVKEVDCWCTGDRTCRFEANISA
ncbi:MAG: 4-vinyl reductase [Holophagaceae bacterium]|nr:4-vinyl reductase [Holophagaceae bacterium]